MTIDPKIPRICGALRVSRQLQKVFNLPAHMTQFKITADLDSNIAQIEATFLFDETMLKEDTDASERTTTGSATEAEQGVTDCTAEAVQGFKPAEAKDGFQAYKFWV